MVSVVGESLPAAVRFCVRGVGGGAVGCVQAIGALFNKLKKANSVILTIAFLLTLRVAIYVFHDPKPYIEDDPRIDAKIALVRKGHHCSGLLWYQSCLNQEEVTKRPVMRNVYAATTFDVPGLGNIMFKYASLYGIATRSERLAVVPRQFVLKEVFKLSNRTLASKAPRPGEKWRKVIEKGSSLYDEVIAELKQPHNIEIIGYLQSWMYFEHVGKELRERHFQFRDDVALAADKFLRDSLHTLQTHSKMFNHQKSVTFVGVHVRRGDLLKEQMVKYGYQVADASYFGRAMRHFSDKLRSRNIVYVVCGDDIKWCKANIKPWGDNQFVVFSEGHSAGVDLAVLSKCNHSITSVGTFSWWSAWLSGGNATFYRGSPRVGSRLDTRAFSQSKEDYYPKRWLGL